MYKVILLLPSVLLGLFVQVHSQECRMNNEYIHNSHSTFVYTDTHNNPQLQRFNFLNEGFTLSLYCYNDAGTAVETRIGCRRGKLMPVTPIACTKPMHTAVQLTDADPYCLATMYRIGIMVNNQFFELYRACYDKASVRSHFSDAIIYWKSIHPKSPRPLFTADGLITQDQVASFSARRIYEAFRRIYGNNQMYARKSNTGNTILLINRGHLTASGDMLFNDQMISTFKYLNVVPQFESINSGNWLAIEHWVGNNIPKKSFVHSRTGALGVLSLPDTTPSRTMRPAYLIPERQQNPVPEWMYKIVRNAKNELLHVFLTYNNVFNPTKPAAHQCCKTVACPLNLPDDPRLGFSYCCNPDHFVSCLPKRH